VALVAPDRVITLTSVSVPAPGALTAEIADTTSCQYADTAYYDDFTPPDSEDPLLADGGAGLQLVYSQLPADSQCVFFHALDSKDALHAALNWYRANIMGRTLAGTDLHATVPTMIVWGDQDPFFCRASIDLSAQYVDGPYRLEVLAGAGHWVPELDPDALDARLLEHLAGSDRDR
jgi:pimeloyl-ACP methyl ester carboxylesterase